jgi:hypothetical protein
MAETKTCMLLESHVNSYNSPDLLLVQKLPNNVLTLYTVHWNGQSAPVQFYLDQYGYRVIMEIEDERYKDDLYRETLALFTSKEDLVYDTIFEFITGNRKLSKYFKLRK